MDWTAQILGLDKSFYNTTEIGGGVIQVCFSSRLSFTSSCPYTFHSLDDSIRLCVDRNCRRTFTIYP
jgi:hypothetical protein